MCIKWKYFIQLIATFVLVLTFAAIPLGRAQAGAVQPPAPPYYGSGTCENWYIVQWGDTLYKIGLKFGVSWPVIAANNGIGWPYWVYAGQYLCISGPGTIPSYPATSFSLRVTGNVIDKNVSIETSTLPINDTIDVLIGKCSDSAYSGKYAGTITTGGTAGVYSNKYKLPSEYYGIACLAVRLTSRVTGFTTYASFTNGSGSSGSSTTGGLTFYASSVQRNKTVTIRASNVEDGIKYRAYINWEGKGAKDGVFVGNFYPGSDPVEIKFRIPDKYQGATKLDLRLECPHTGEVLVRTFLNSTY